MVEVDVMEVVDVVVVVVDLVEVSVVEEDLWSGWMKIS